MKKGAFLLTLFAAIASAPQVWAQAPPGLSMTLANPGPVGAATTTAIFAQFAIGGGYTTVFTFVNPGSSALTGNLILTNHDGTFSNDSLSSSDGTTATGFSIAVNVAQGGTTLITASPVNPTDPNTATGWARLESSGGAPGGVATYNWSPTGTLQTTVGVLSSTLLSSTTIPVNNDQTVNRETGYAVANTGATPINVKIVVVDIFGNIVNSITPALLNPLPPGWQVARFLYQDLPSVATFKGSMVLIEQTGQNFAAVALSQAQGTTGALFSAIPVTPGKAPNIN